MSNLTMLMAMHSGEDIVSKCHKERRSEIRWLACATQALFGALEVLEITRGR